MSKKGKKMIISVNETVGRVHGKQWKDEEDFIKGKRWKSQWETNERRR